ncbi:hypothetical protein OAV86_05370, partial [Pseudomonadales bacterium]|nr:hypothetical protein [Pseudomonadales bacterium]
TDNDGTGNNADTDDDGDGVADGQDAFPLDATEALDTDVDGTGNNSDTDDDNDGVEDTSDAFPLDASETVDSDNDGVGDNSDAFPDDATESIDSDSDSVGDNADNCPSKQNSDQTNTDGDLFGNACDLDDDNDGNTDQRETADGTDPLDPTSCLNCVNNLATGGIRSLGTNGPDEIEGTDFDDVLSSFGGDDNISGSGGNDLISGGEGDDNLSGGSGDDDIQGDDGNDLLSGGSGDDVLSGGDGDDLISGGSGEDRIFGGIGADVISGGSGDDYIEGGTGSDLISGGSGSDQLFGGDGADVISAGSGFNSVNGGSGEDIFTIASLVVSSELITQISDYEDGLDLIASYLPITAIKNYSEETFLGVEEGVTIVFSDGRSFQLAGLEAESLTLDDFICFGENTSLSELNDSRNLQADCDLDGDGFSNLTEVADGTDPLNRFSCRSGCFSFDVDENLEAQPLTDGLLVIRHLFGFSGDSLTSGAVSGEASRDSSDAIAGYLTDANSELDIDGDGESKPLTDGLLLIRYLFGFSGDSLISGAIGDGAERDTAEEVEAYIKERVPVQ